MVDTDRGDLEVVDNYGYRRLQRCKFEKRRSSLRHPDEVRPDSVIEYVSSEALRHVPARMNGHAIGGSGVNVVHKERQRGDVIDMAVRKEDVFDPGLIFR